MQFAICQAIDSENKVHILEALYIFVELTTKKGQGWCGGKQEVNSIVCYQETGSISLFLIWFDASFN